MSLSSLLATSSINSGAASKRSYESAIGAQIAPYAFLKAAKAGNISIVNTALLEAHIDIECVNVNLGSKTALQLAVYNRHIDIVKFLLEHGADSTINDDKHNTLLHIAASMGMVSICQVLHDYWQSIQFKNPRFNAEGLAAIHLAALNGHLDVVKLFIDSFGENVDTPDRINRTPLLFAIKYKHTALVLWLIQKYADITIDCGTIPSLLLHALSGTDPEVVSFLLSHPKIHPLINTSRIYDGTFPIHLAALNGDFRALNILLDMGAGINQVDISGQTPLMHALRGGSLSCLSLLLRRGANINSVDQNGKTPLFFTNKPAQIRMLLRADIKLCIPTALLNQQANNSTLFFEVDDKLQSLVAFEKHACSCVEILSNKMVKELAILCCDYALGSDGSNVDRFIVLRERWIQDGATKMSIIYPPLTIAFNSHDFDVWSFIYNNFSKLSSEVGVSLDSILIRCTHHDYSKNEIHRALNKFLSTGYLYHTIDNEHFAISDHYLDTHDQG